MDQKLLYKIKQREEEGTLRSLSHFEGFTDFFSNDYLGMSTMSVGTDVSRTGGTGSRLISGTTNEVLKSEQAIANFFGSEASLMFNSGYDANLGFFSAVPQRGDTVLFDALIHASIRDGIRLGFARAHAFNHNDLSDLETKLSATEGTVYVVVESLYSMDGDMAPLAELIALCQQYKAYLIVDEAHACGVFGKNGRGLVNEINQELDVFARIVTFGKAYGSHGACVLGSEGLIQFLANFARSFIYTTALPSYVYAHNANKVVAPSIRDRVKALENNVAYFRRQFQSAQLISSERSPIQVVLIGDIAATRKLAEIFQEAQLAVKPIFSPTVPAGQERIRICLHSFNTMDEIDRLIAVLRA